LDEAAQNGLKKLCSSSRMGCGDIAALAEKYSKNAGLTDAFKKTLALSTSDPKFVGWTSQASQNTLDKLVRFTVDYPDAGIDRFLKRLCSTACDDPAFDKQLFNMLNRIGNDAGPRKLLRPDRNEEVYNGVVQALRTAMHPNTSDFTKNGWLFQIKRAAYYDETTTGLAKFEVLDAAKNKLDLVLKNGTVVEVKYITADVFTDSYVKGTLAPQIKRQFETNGSVIVEFAERGPASVTQEMIDSMLKPALTALGVNINSPSLKLIPHVY
jgi:hypothetical protein